MTTTLITPPALEPLSLAEIKAHLRIDNDHEDSVLADTLKAARQYCEFTSGHKLITQLWRQYESGYPDNQVIELRVHPVQSISSVTAYDREGNPTLIDPSMWELVGGDHETRLHIDVLVDQIAAENGIEIDLVAGLGDLGVDVSDTLKRAILLLVAHWYEFRGAISPQDQPVSVPPGYEALMAPYKRVRL